MHPPVRDESRDGIRWIDFDDGVVNALSEARITELSAALDRAEAAGEVAVLRGRPGIFSAGFDLKTFQRGAEAGVALVRAGAELVLRLLAFPRPVLSVCTGHAYPAGAFLMLASDSRLGLTGPFRIGLNEVSIAMTVPRFAVELVRHRLAPAGLAQVATGRLFSPEQAVALGYLDRVCEPDDLDAAVAEEALRLRALDMEAFVATKARINAPAQEAIRAAIDVELATVGAPSRLD